MEKGWSLYHASPDARLRVSQRMVRQHPDSVVVLLHDSHARRCVLFAVERPVLLRDFLRWVAPQFVDTGAKVQVEFDGKLFAETCGLGFIFSVQARDDGVLHGCVLPEALV